nr:MAG TPA: hypothetical protein [Caudoviricetes sp.]
MARLFVKKHLRSQWDKSIYYLSDDLQLDRREERLSNLYIFIFTDII